MALLCCFSSLQITICTTIYPKIGNIHPFHTAGTVTSASLSNICCRPKNRWLCTVTKTYYSWGCVFADVHIVLYMWHCKSTSYVYTVVFVVQIVHCAQSHVLLLEWSNSVYRQWEYPENDGSWWLTFTHHRLMRKRMRQHVGEYPKNWKAT